MSAFEIDVRSAAHTGLAHRVVLLSERDRLVLEWEVHQARFLMQRMLEIDPGPPIDREYLERVIAEHYRGNLQWFRRAGGMTYDEQVAMAERQWQAVPRFVDEALERYAAERAWLKDNAPGAPTALLRRAVRRAMTQAGGARPELMDEADQLTDDAPDGPTTIRSLHWLLAVRCEIAFRRMICGEAHLLLSEGFERPTWIRSHITRLKQRSGQFGAGGYAALEGLDTNGTLALCRRRERAAAAHQITGTHRAPDALNLERIGAGDTA